MQSFTEGSASVCRVLLKVVHFLLRGAMDTEYIAVSIVCEFLSF